MSSPVQQLLNERASRELLRFCTAGSVDDGKSTLIGRLLHDSKSLCEDHLQALNKRASRKGQESIDLALITDGLRAEEEQGITIDVAYRFMATPKRRFILADTPGHVQYTRNMATGASTAALAVILIDARHGVIEQTRRHSFIAALLGVPRFLIAINKMDLVDYAQARFDEIRQSYLEFARRLGVKELRFVPIAALHGDNVVTSSANMPWYHGESVLEYLENVYIGADRNTVDLRFPVQCVIRPHQDYRGYAGQVRSGSIRVGEEILVLPGKQRARIRSIDLAGQPKGLTEAEAPQAVVLTLDRELDVSRGSLIVRPNNLPEITDRFDAMVVWMAEEPMKPQARYRVLHTSRAVGAVVDRIHYAIEMEGLHRTAADTLRLNDIGRVTLLTREPLFLDSYRRNRSTGNFILIDEESGATVAGGMVLDQTSEPDGVGLAEVTATELLHREAGSVTRQEREARAGGRALTLWCTGLSGSGKSTIAAGVERALFDAGLSVYRLDGDNLRLGLNRGLGFSQIDRMENIRRAAEVARLMNDAGVTVICSLISPRAEDRRMACEIIGADRFVEIYVSTRLEVCEERDPHGLYKRARAGEIKGFTGVDAPYEAPTAPDLVLDAGTDSVEPLVARVVAEVAARCKIGSQS